MQTSGTQLGFLKGMCTREAVFALNFSGQSCREVNRDVYLCSIAYIKAYDNEKHEK